MPQSIGENFLKYPAAVGRLAIVIINNIYCIPTYVLWMMMLLPLKRFNPKIYYRVEGLFFHWLLAVVSMWSYSAGYDIVEVGDDITECKNKRTIVIANHQSTADVPLLMANFNAKENILPNLMWIMDRLFKFTNFGIVSIIHQDFFIIAGRKNRDESINALKNHIKTSFLKLDRKWMVLFPEGGFLRKRRVTSQRFAEKNNLPILEYVTLPRVGAFVAIFEAMSKNSLIDNNDDISNNEIDNKTNNDCNKMMKNNKKQLDTSSSSSITNKDVVDSSINRKTITDTINKSNNISTKLNTDILSNGELLKDNNMKKENGTELNSSALKTFSSDCLLEYVLDITIAYPNGIPLDLPNIIHGWRDPCKTYMFYRLYKVNQIPKDYNGLTQWLYDRFIEKNDLLKNFYNYGEFFYSKHSQHDHHHHPSHYVHHTNSKEKIMSTSTTTVNMLTKKNLIQQDVLRFVLINLFFITSTYLHYQLFCVIYSYCSIFMCNVIS